MDSKCGFRKYTEAPNLAENPSRLIKDIESENWHSDSLFSDSAETKKNWNKTKEQQLDDI